MQSDPTFPCGLWQVTQFALAGIRTSDVSLTVPRLVALVAFHARVFRVIELRLRHPAIDQDWFCHHRRAVRRCLHFVTESAAGEVGADGGGRLPLRLVGIGREKHGALQFFPGTKLLLELPDLLDHEILDVDVARLASLETRVIAVLRRQRAQKRPDQPRVAVRNPQVRIFHVELERVASLAVRGEADPLVEPAVRLRFVAVIAIELLAVHWRNIRREMALVIEAEHVGVARSFAHELELRMCAGKGIEDLSVTARRPRHLEDDLLRRMGSKMECGRRQSRSLLRRRFHDAAIIVTRSALRIGHRFHRPRPEMFHVADGAGTIFDHVRFVQVVFLRRPERRIFFVALLAFVIDRTEIEAAVKAVFDDALEFRQREIAPYHRGLVMTLSAILFELRVMAGDFSGAEKLLARPSLKNHLLINDDGRHAADEGDEAGEEAGHAPGMLPFVIAEIAFVTLGNLLLGSSWRGHGFNS